MSLVAVMRSDESAAALRMVLEGTSSAETDIHVADVAKISQDKSLVNGHDVLLIDLDAENGPETEQLGHFIKELGRSKPVIVTTANAGLEDIRRIMGMGAVDVLSQPIREVDLMVALDHAARGRAGGIEAASHKGKVISFIKGGGGAGATTLAVQGAGILAAGGKGKKAKKDAPKVCVLDLDIQFGAVGLYLDIKSSVGLTDLLESPERNDLSLLDSVMSQHESGLDVLTGPDNVLPLEAITPDFVTGLLDLACEAYDYVLVDLPQSWTTWTYAALCRSDLIVLVTQLTVAGIRQAVHQLGTMRLQEIDSVPVKIALNRSNKKWGFQKSSQFKDAENALGQKFDYVILNSYEMTSEAINNGVLLGKIKRNSKLEKNIAMMMENIRQSVADKEQRVAIHATA